MKKLYRLLFVAVVALCASFAAKAEDVSVTVKWDVPGSLVFSISKQVIDVPADATEYTFTREKTTWPSLRVEPAPGYVITSGTYNNPSYTSAPTGVVNINKVQGYASLSFIGTQYNGATVTFTTKKLEKDGKITLNIENGASFLKDIYFPAANGVSREDISLDKGNSSYEVPIYNGIQTSLYIASVDNRHIYSVTGGSNVSFGYDNRNATVTVADGAVVNVRVFEGEEPVVKECTVNLQYAEGIEGCVTSAFNNTAFQSITIADNKFTVKDGQQVTLNFNEDYNITSINDGAIAYDSENNRAQFTVSDDMTVKIDGTPKQYANITYTAYITNAEAVEIWQGNKVKGSKVELGEGTLVTEDITLKSVSESGTVIDGQYVIPAGTARKYTFKVSDKYGSYNVYVEKEGYYIAHGRLVSGSSQQNFSNPASSDCYLAVAKVNTDSNLKVVMVGDATQTNLRTGSTFGGGRKITLAEGYNNVGFDNVYDNPFTFAFIDNGQGNLKVVYGNNELKADDYGHYSFTAADNGVLRLYNDGKAHAKRTVTFTVGDDAYAEVSYDHGTALTNLDTPASLWDGTEVTITPEDENLIVMLDGNKLTPNSDEYVFTVSKDHSVEIKNNPAAYELYPSAQAPVTSLETLVVAFPFATAGTINMAADEAMIASNGSFAPISTTVEDVTSTFGCPAYRFTVSPAPSVSGMYNVYIPEGFFTLDGVSSTEIMETYTLNVASSLTYSFDPEYITAGEYNNFAVLFDENHAITSYDEAKISVSINGQKLAAGEYELTTETCMLFGMIKSDKYFNVTGTLSIDIEEGAIKFSDGECPAISHTWDIVALPEYSFVLNPDNFTTANQLTSITLQISGAQSASVANTSGISLRDNKYAYFGTATITAVEGAEIPTFKLEFPEIPETEGVRNYSLVINYGTFLLDGMFKNEYFTRNFNSLSGVENIAVDGSDSNDAIYNLQGQRMQSRWENLPAGLYIRGGQKVIKK